MCAAKSEESPERNVFDETPSHVTHGEYKKMWTPGAIYII